MNEGRMPLRGGQLCSRCGSGDRVVRVPRTCKPDIDLCAACEFENRKVSSDVARAVGERIAANYIQHLSQKLQGERDAAD